MKICHISHVMPERASYRYRIFLPGAVLERAGHEVGTAEKPEEADVIVWHKHGPLLDPEAIGRHPSVFDVSDDHFDHPDLGSQYREAIAAAKLVTCSSQALGWRIHQVTGRHAVYVADPYEFEPGEVRWFGIKSVLWFGHQSNIDVLRGLPLDCPVEVVTGCKPGGDGVRVRWTPWSLPALLQAFERHDTVIVPRGTSEKERVKGNNRIVNALRRGKFVVAADIPSHRELNSVIRIEDTLAGIQWGRAYSEEAQSMMAKGQAYVAQRYSPERIAGHWLEVFKEVAGERRGEAMGREPQGAAGRAGA